MCLPAGDIKCTQILLQPFVGRIGSPFCGVAPGVNFLAFGRVLEEQAVSTSLLHSYAYPRPRINVESPKFSFPCYLSSKKSHVWKTGRSYSGRCKAPRCIGKFRRVRQYHIILGEGLRRSNRALYGIVWLHRMSDMHRFPDDLVEVAKYSW